MWHDHVAPAIASLLQGRQRIVHHVLNCFGAGESQIESMLQGMTHRTHQPRVGIIASQATISLRISAAGTDESNCQQQIKPVAERIRTLLGDLIYGENDVTLEQVVVEKLRAANFTCGIVDFGFGGAVGLALFTADPQRQWIKHSESKFQEVSGASLAGEAENLKMKYGLDIAVAVGNVYQIPEQTELNFDLAISNPARTYQQTLRHGGHSGLRDSRTAKQILNQIRLFLSQ
jgi:nicotinamide-nucleotide amidase